MAPELAEIEAAAARLEKRFRGDPWYPLYGKLCRRFAADLRDRRDIALSRGAALMLIKLKAEEDGGA